MVEDGVGFPAVVRPGTFVDVDFTLSMALDSQSDKVEFDEVFPPFAKTIDLLVTDNPTVSCTVGGTVGHCQYTPPTSLRSLCSLHQYAKRQTKL